MVCQRQLVTERSCVIVILLTQGIYSRLCIDCDSLCIANTIYSFTKKHDEIIKKWIVCKILYLFCHVYIILFLLYMYAQNILYNIIHNKLLFKKKFLFFIIYLKLIEKDTILPFSESLKIFNLIKSLQNYKNWKKLQLTISEKILCNILYKTESNCYKIKK